MTLGYPISRRSFLGIVAAAAVASAVPLLSSGCTTGDISKSDSTRSITDMAGREVVLPEHISKLYSTGQPGVVATYMLAPDKLLGWCMQPSSDESEYIEEAYRALPVLGLMQGENNTANREEIISRAPDIVLLMTSLADESYVQSATEDADSITSKMDIPVVVCDYSLNMMGEAFRFLGSLLDATERAEELASYCESIYSDAIQKASTIKEEDRIGVYYAQGQSGLQTAPQGSSHSEVIDLVGGDNVAKIEFGSGGRANVDMEQVLIWNPKVIITSYSMSHTVDGNEVFSLIVDGDKSWAEVDAVIDGRIYNTPCLPFNWQDMPPSANRFMGISWMGNLLYPNVFELDIREQTRDFYKLFYRLELSEEQIDALLENATATAS